ncbi:MAG: glycosyltransferase family 9 protein [Promethearchaeota archaeon]|jgi:heptosyltransferase-2
MLKKDCAHFYGDRPCDFHKNDGRKCDDCDEYNPIKYKILIIKLDAIGDVLRTTSILPAIKKKYPNSYITWCTRKSARELFTNSDFVNEVILFEDDALIRNNVEQFDLVINLDTSKVSSAIASSAKGQMKQGFVLTGKGYVEATSAVAEKWLEMSAFDDIKRNNKKSYQSLMYEILELDGSICTPIIRVPEKASNTITSKSKKWNLRPGEQIIGLNIGVGTKWPSKGWPIERWEELINILENKKFNLLLLGGPEEIEEMNTLSAKYKFLTNTDYDNSMMEFAAIVNMCDIIITADSLALHIGTALSKKLVVLFGPTSVMEIDLYGKGRKLRAPDECKCFYKKFCMQEESCMEKITAEMVYNAVEELL